MEAIQITGFTAEQFKQFMEKTAFDAAQKAVDGMMKIKQDPNEDITIADIAEQWKCSKMTVFRRVKDHKVPTVKLGRELAIKRKFLETIKKPIPKEK